LLKIETTSSKHMLFIKQSKGINQNEIWQTDEPK